MNTNGPRPTAKRHHVVPQFYLRGFADDEKLATIRLPGDLRFTQSVRRAASETNFYAIEGHLDGVDAFEKVLAGIEGEAARVLESVARGTWPLPIDDRATLGYFVALQAVRGPDHRRTMEFTLAQHARLEIGFSGKAGVKGWFERNRGLALTDEEAEAAWEQPTQPSGPPIRVSPDVHIRQIAKLSDGLLKYLLGRPWSLVEFDKRSLITSDAPVGLVRDPEDAETWMGVGFLTASAISFPLTRKLGLWMSDPMASADRFPVEMVHAGEANTRHFGTTAIEKLFNHHTIANASEWLFHHPADGRFVPVDLPEPSPVSMHVVGGPIEFTGEPLFPRRNDAN